MPTIITANSVVSLRKIFKIIKIRPEVILDLVTIIGFSSVLFSLPWESILPIQWSLSFTVVEYASDGFHLLVMGRGWGGCKFQGKGNEIHHHQRLLICN